MKASLLLVVMAIVLAGCDTAPKRGGGFYQDDGPPAQVPADIMATPDAVPRIEAFHPYANRPYVALGTRYVPLLDDRPYRARGHASWYGRQFHGNRTAIGERYDMFAMTAAHPTLPLPSYARVTNVRTGAAVIVRVNDRGPFKADRIIDLSFAAATRLGIAAAGTGEVEVERITHSQLAAASTSPASASTASPTPTPTTIALAVSEPAPPRVVDSPAPASQPVWAVQLGAFEIEANAQALRERMSFLLAAPQADGLPAMARSPRVERDGILHRVLIGTLSERAEAAELAARLATLLGRDTALLLR